MTIEDDSHIRAVDMYKEVKVDALSILEQASSLAITEIVEENGGIPDSIDQFVLATHGFVPENRRQNLADTTKITDFYESLEQQFGEGGEGKMIALLDTMESEGRQRILRIGYIVAGETQPGSLLVRRVIESPSHGYLQGEVNVRVANPVDVSVLDEPTHGNRMRDNMLVSELVAEPLEEEDTTDELWLLSYASVINPDRDRLPSRNTGYYQVGLGNILSARTFRETNTAYAESDLRYLGIVTEALGRVRQAQNRV